MPRSIVFGNQTLLVGLDANYVIRDIYYPHVGMENHLNGHRNRMGIWIDGKFSWLDDSEWKKNIQYESETLIGNVRLENSRLNIKCLIQDMVHPKRNTFLRKITFENTEENAYNIRFFFSHDLQLYETNIGITAYYDPDTNAVIHYLKDRYFLFSGRGIHPQIDSWATGKAHFGKEGTYRDAEDGKLSENSVDQGAVDSTIQINQIIPAKGSAVIEYWFTVGYNYRDVRGLHEFIQSSSIDDLINKIRAYDYAWVNKNNFIFHGLTPKIINLFKRSLLIVKTQIDKNGAIIAANDSDILQFNRDHYSYMWPRDGALVAYALDKAGYGTITQKFYSFCSQIAGPRGVMLHKYNPDGSPGSTWHPWYKKGEGKIVAIQEDETALILFALWSHYQKFRDLDFVNDLYSKFIVNAGDFLEDFRDDRGLPKPSYDLWEERRGILTFTISAVYAGLMAAANFAHLFGDEERENKFKKAAKEVKEAMVTFLFDPELNRFVRMINFREDGTIEKDTIIDASVYAIFEFGVFPATDPRVISTMSRMKEKLWVKTDVGGLARYENDYYHQVSNNLDDVPGNPWFICTLWLAEFYIHLAGIAETEEIEAKKLLDQAKHLMEWVADRALSSGLLAEQVNPYTDQPISVSPLTWSHATFILCVAEYLEKYSLLKTCKNCQQHLPIYAFFHEFHEEDTNNEK